MDFQALDIVPAYVQSIWVDGRCVNKDAPVKWGGNVAPPPIGAEIVVMMNRCGPAIVTGYFIEGGWLGVRCTLTDPPEWHVKQNKGDPDGFIFGPEFKMKGE